LYGVDGDSANAVWVSESEGLDSNNGTITSPVKTITKGLALAALIANGKRNVYVVTGTYAEDVTVTDDINLYGGYGLLTAPNTRERNRDSYRPVIIGVNGGSVTTIHFHSGDFPVSYTLLLQSTKSIVDDFEIHGDVSGLCVILFDADATLINNVIEDDDPLVERDMSISLTTIVSDVSTSTRKVTLQNNEILMHGTGGGSSNNDSFGILAYPAMNADTGLVLTVKDNTIISDGITEAVYPVMIADDDDNPFDNPIGDGHADFEINLVKNTMSINGTLAGTIGFVGGRDAFGGFDGPSGDNLVYLKKATIEQNRFDFNLIGAEGEMGIECAMVRDGCDVANNIITMEGDAEMSIGFFSFIAQMNITSNTLAVNTSGSQAMGVSFFHTDDAVSIPEAINYMALTAGDVVDNIFSLKQTTSNPSCYTAGLVENVDTVNDSYVNAASPESFQDNNLFFETNCSKIILYGDQLDSTNHTIITNLNDLNSKTGFRPDDPTIVSGNISADPQLTF